MQGRVVTETTFDVKVWATEKYVGTKVTTYRVIWKVGPKRWKVGHRTSAAAESFRSELLTALRRGEAFDVETGRPVSVVRRDSPDVSWYEFACEYVDLKWPSASPNHRMGTANVLMSVTTALMAESMPAHKEAAQAVRSALINWAFNARRGSDDQPEWVTAELDWVSRNSPPLTALTKPKVMRAVLASFETRLDGKRAAGRTAAWRRSVLSTAMNYAVEAGLLSANPVGAIRWKAPKSSDAVDRRSVVNPDQARTLLAAVALTPRSGKHLQAFFGVMYYSALRPEEAANLRQANLDLPSEGWGWITLEQAAPELGRQWSDSGERRELLSWLIRLVRDLPGFGARRGSLVAARG